MTQDEIIAMAKEAGMVTGPNLLFSEGQRYRSLGAPRNIKERHLLRFAALVEAKAAAKEREACAQVCDDIEAPWDCEYPLIFQSAVDAYAAAIRARSTT